MQRIYKLLVVSVALALVVFAATWFLMTPPSRDEDPVVAGLRRVSVHYDDQGHRLECFVPIEPLEKAWGAFRKQCSKIRREEKFKGHFAALFDQPSHASAPTGSFVNGFQADAEEAKYLLAWYFFEPSTQESKLMIFSESMASSPAQTETIN